MKFIKCLVSIKVSSLTQSSCFLDTAQGSSNIDLRINNGKPNSCR